MMDVAEFMASRISAKWYAVGFGTELVGVYSLVVSLLAKCKMCLYTTIILLIIGVIFIEIGTHVENKILHRRL